MADRPLTPWLLAAAMAVVVAVSLLFPPRAGSPEGTGVQPNASAVPAVRSEAGQVLRAHRTGLPLERMPAAANDGPPPNLTRALMNALGLEIRIDDVRTVQYPLESVFALPGETVEVRASVYGDDPVTVRAESGSLEQLPTEGVWAWTAPEEPGEMTRLWVDHPTSGTTVTLHAFVLVPADQVENGRLNGYRIGNYPQTPLRGNPIYSPPRGFVEVTEENLDTRLSPHFQLRHFPAKQASGYPKYIVVRPALLVKLERILEALNDRGYPVQSFHVMSGYRTPHYNVGVLGNARYSRHQWGGAADIFVDERPRNGRMDDLDGDGAVTLSDARVLHSVIDSLDLDMGSNITVGGLGLYRANAVRGPFVHVDVRGTRARW